MKTKKLKIRTLVVAVLLMKAFVANAQSATDRLFDNVVKKMVLVSEYPKSDELEVALHIKGRDFSLIYEMPTSGDSEGIRSIMLRDKHEELTFFLSQESNYGATWYYGGPGDGGYYLTKKETSMLLQKISVLIDRGVKKEKMTQKERRKKESSSSVR